MRSSVGAESLKAYRLNFLGWPIASEIIESVEISQKLSPTDTHHDVQNLEKPTKSCPSTNPGFTPYLYRGRATRLKASSMNREIDRGKLNCFMFVLILRGIGECGDDMCVHDHDFESSNGKESPEFCMPNQSSLGKSSAPKARGSSRRRTDMTPQTPKGPDAGA